LTIEDWARDYIAAETLAEKLAPPPPPSAFAERAISLRVAGPGRGKGFLVSPSGEKSSGKSQLRSPERRASLIHRFLHHELQAAELMAWAVLAFPETPPAFRRGLLGILGDEIRHMNLYAKYLIDRGKDPASFPVRDWFWERVPTVLTPEQFCATMGMGLEAANLDHAARFARRFREAGDEEAAQIEEIVGREEIPHVMFATRWYERFTNDRPSSFDTWARHLPAPLSPMLMRGPELDRAARIEAGATAAFVDALERWTPS
jgi:uncharacterized ferritin-like protein (DUF455 family)